MKARADIGKNRLYLEISGSVSKQALANLYTDVRFQVADLQPGFGVINDLTRSRLGHVSGVPTFRKIMHYLVENGVGEVVRVINANSLLFKQIHNISSMVCSYIPTYVSTMEEAEKKLDQVERRNGLRFHFTELPPVRYLLHGEKQKGTVLNISISGCKIKSATTIPLVDEKLVLTFTFNSAAVEGEAFELAARVVRVENDGCFAVAYENVDDDMMARLSQCFLKEFQYEHQYASENAKYAVNS